MDFVILFLTAYGLCFGLMNGKVKILTDRLKRIPFRLQETEEQTTTFFQRMLVCPYCTGFHSGWISWFLVRGYGTFSQLSGDLTSDVISVLSEIIAVAYASAAICYLLDTFAQWAEETAHKP